MVLYPAAKAAEHALNLEWVREQIDRLRAANVPHGVLLDRLEIKLAEDAQRLRWLENAVQTPGMELQAHAVSQVLGASLRGMSEHYVAGLLHQSPAELRWRELLLAALRRLQLDWIEDLLVRLSRDLAVLPAFRGDDSIPVLFAPPNQHETFLSLPGIYHEFGHCVENRHREVLEALQQVVATYFAKEKLMMGPVLPQLRDANNKKLDEAAQYWNETRLAELFCDLFASYACGAANFLSMVDLARGSGVLPCSTDHPYPPYAVRVRGAHYALTDEQRAQPIVANAWNEWTRFEQQWREPTQYQFFCPQKLIRELADTSNALITRLQPNTARNLGLLPSLADAQSAAPGENLEEIIASGMVVLWGAPSEFLLWRQRVFAAARIA